jgi:small GTP-binding protein
VFVGDGATGKTCLCRTYVHGYPRMEYIPTVFDNYSFELKLPEEQVTLGIFDTAGQEDNDRLRPLSFENTDVMIVSFSIRAPASLDNVVEKWCPEVEHFVKGAHILLAGLQSDAREGRKMTGNPRNLSEEPVTYTRGVEIAKKIGASAYLECSSVKNSRRGAIVPSGSCVGSGMISLGPSQERVKKSTLYGDAMSISVAALGPSRISNIASVTPPIKRARTEVDFAVSWYSAPYVRSNVVLTHSLRLTHKRIHNFRSISSELNLGYGSRLDRMSEDLASSLEPKLSSRANWKLMSGKGRQEVLRERLGMHRHTGRLVEALLLIRSSVHSCRDRR